MAEGRDRQRWQWWQQVVEGMGAGVCGFNSSPRWGLELESQQPPSPLLPPTCTWFQNEELFPLMLNGENTSSWIWVITIIRKHSAYSCDWLLFCIRWFSSRAYYRNEPGQEAATIWLQRMGDWLPLLMCTSVEGTYNCVFPLDGHLKLKVPLANEPKALRYRTLWKSSLWELPLPSFPSPSSPPGPGSSGKISRWAYWERNVKEKLSKKI